MLSPYDTFKATSANFTDPMKLNHCNWSWLLWESVAMSSYVLRAEKVT